MGFSIPKFVASVRSNSTLALAKGAALLCKLPLADGALQQSRLQSPGVTIPVSQAPRLAQGALGSHTPAPPEPPSWFDAPDAERGSVREGASVLEKGDGQKGGLATVQVLRL